MELRKATFFEAKCFRNNFRSAANAYVINRFQLQIILQQLLVDKLSPHLPKLYPRTKFNSNLDGASVEKKLREEFMSKKNSILGQLKCSKFMNEVKEVPKRTYNIGSFKAARKYASNSTRRPKSITETELPKQLIDENNNTCIALKVNSNVNSKKKAVKSDQEAKSMHPPEVTIPNPFDNFKFSDQPKLFLKHSNKTKPKYYFNKYDIPYLIHSLKQ